MDAQGSHWAGLAVERAWQEPELPQPGSARQLGSQAGAASGWQLRIPRPMGDGSFGSNVRHCGGLRQGTNERGTKQGCAPSCTPMLAAKQQYRRCDPESANPRSHSIQLCGPGAHRVMQILPCLGAPRLAVCHHHNRLEESKIQQNEQDENIPSGPAHES